MHKFSHVSMNNRIDSNATQDIIEVYEYYIILLFSF